MADGITKRARRDATLAVSDELASVSQMERQAKRESKQAYNDLSHATELEIRGLYSDQRREEYDLLSLASSANMGTSGFAMAGVTDLARKKSAASADIRSKAQTQFQQIADQLSATLSEAKQARRSIDTKRTLLIGQLSDQYRQEAQQLALQKEQNAIAWANARETKRHNLAAEGLSGAGKKGEKDAHNAYVAGVMKHIQETRDSYLANKTPFKPSLMWPMYESDPTLTEVDRKAIWKMLYPGGTPYPGTSATAAASKATASLLGDSRTVIEQQQGGLPWASPKGTSIPMRTQMRPMSGTYSTFSSASGFKPFSWWTRPY